MNFERKGCFGACADDRGHLCTSVCEQRPACEYWTRRNRTRPENAAEAGLIRVLAEVRDERARQNGKWGVQNHDPFTFGAILAEEVGELAQAALETRFPGKHGGYARMRAEAIQVAAVAVQIVEALDRDEWAWGETRTTPATTTDGEENPQAGDPGTIDLFADVPPASPPPEAKKVRKPGIPKPETSPSVLRLLEAETAPQALRDLAPRILADRKGSLGPLRPWAWWTEVVRGCNLRCGFCPTRLFPAGEFSFMTMETWRAMLEVIRDVSPLCRLEIGNAGEQTLHPSLPEFFAEARRIVPTVQLMMYTNGTTLIDGSRTYRDWFEAGLNMVFVDCYAPREKHLELAKASGYRFFEEEARPEDFNVFEYQGDPDVHAIMLCRQPGDWAPRKKSRGQFHTFLNNLDWEAARKFGLEPVTTPPSRRCDIPFKFPTVYWDGSYSFCCVDFFREVAGSLGNVSEGPEGFLRYWFGPYMQDLRRRLASKDRASHPMCQRCSMTTIRCDVPTRWPDEFLPHSWDGERWASLPSGEAPAAPGGEYPTAQEGER